MSKSLQAHTFKDSDATFRQVLDEHNISYNRRFQFSSVPVASAIPLEIIIEGAFYTLAVACLAWANYKSGRKISVTTKKKEIIWAKGYSAEDFAKILEDAVELGVIDTNKPEEDGD